MEAVYKSGGKVASTEQGLVLDKPSAVILKVAPEQIAKSTRVGNDLVLTLVDGTQIYVNGFFAAYAEEGRNDLVLEDQQGVLWWGQYGGVWEGFEFTEIESNESVAAWLPWLVGLGLGGLAVSSGGSGGGGKNVNNPPEPVDPNEGLSPGAPGHVPGQEFSNGGYKVTVREDQPFNGKVVGKDSDGDSLTYGLGTPPAHGTVTIDKNTGEYTYTPNKDWSGPGTDSFEVIVDDGKGGKTTTTVTVNVGAEQDAYDDIEGTGFGKSVTVDVLGNDKFAGHNVTITQVDGKAITEGGAAVALTDGSGSVKLVGGKLEFTPKAGFVGDAKFTYTAQTDGGTPETANVTVTVAANQLPEPTDSNEGLDPGDPDYIPGQTFTPGGGYTVTVGEDTPFNGKITGTDKDNDPLTYELGTPPAHGTVTVTPDGKYTYTPNKDWSGPGTDEFTVIVDDGKGGKTTTTVTVNVTPEQDVTDDTATTGFDKSVTIDVLGNDDFEGDNVKITEVNGTAIAEGQTVVVADGSVKLVGGKLEFTPTAGFVGDAKFTYTAQTDGGTPEQANVTVTVAANQLPEPTDPNIDPGNPEFPGQTFTPGPYGGYKITVGEDQPFNGKVTGTDKDGDELTYTQGTGPSHGTVTIDKDTGKYTYTPDPDYNGPDAFTVIVDDGKGGKTTTTVTVEFTPEQDVTDDTATTGYDKPVTIDVLGNDDFEGDNVKITEVNGTAIAEGQTVVVADGSVKLVGGQLEFTPKAGFVGDAKFTYTAQTDGGTPEQANVTVTVAANQLPEPTDPNIDPGNPEFPGQTFTPGPNGGYKITVGEDQPFNGKVTGTDKDGDTLTYTTGTDPKHGTVTVDKETGKYTYTPDPDYNGPDAFTVIVDDGKGGKTTTTVTVEFTPEQDVTDDTATTGYDKPVTIDVLGNDDFEGDNLTITQVDGKAITEGGAAVALTDGSGSVKLVGGKLEFTPKAGFVGDAKFTYTAQTDGGTPEQANVTVTVAANQLPEPTDPNIDLGNPEFPGQTFTPGPNGGYKITVGEDQPFNGKVTGTDKDNDPLTYELGDPPAHGTVTVDKETGKYTYTPDPDYNGPDAFTVIVDDGKGGQTTTAVTVEFKPEVDVVDDTATTGYEKSVTIDVLGNDDFEGDNVKITEVNGTAIAEGQTVVVADGSVKLVGGQLEFTPKAGFVGDAKFTYTAQTDGGTPEQANVTVTVAANQLPEPTDPNAGLDPQDPNYVKDQEFKDGGYKITVDEDQPFSGKVTGSDKDGDTLTYTTGTDPKHGTVTVDKETGKYTYTPDPDYNGPDEFTVIVDDGKGGKTTTTVTVEFKPEVDVADDTAATSYEKSVTIDVLGNDEFEGDHPTITQVDGKAIADNETVDVANGKVTLVGGQLVFTPDAGFHGDTSFSYTAKTDKGSEETAKVTVTVNSLPEFDDTGLPPGTTLTADGYVIGYDEGRTSTDVLGKVHAVDPDSSDAVKYSIDPASNPNGWFQIDENTGEIRLTEEGVKSLANDFEDEDGRNSHQITVIATDSAGGKTSIQVALNEQDVNDTAPVLEIAPGDKVLHVAEEALSGGIKDDPNSTTTATGKISFTDADKTPDINTFSVEMKGPADGSITSGGVAVTWSWDASSSTLTGMAGAKEVMTVKVGALTEVNGKYEAGYTVTLKGPVDHPKAQGENSLDLDFKAIVHDGVHDSEIEFAVEVKDDVPTLSDDAELAINLSKLQTNLMIVLDLSGSMAGDRLAKAKIALKDLIEKYDEFGDVMVKLVTFSSSGNAIANWKSAADAIGIINGFAANGGTNYVAALNAAMSSNGFTDNAGKLTGAGVQNVSYFITDGVPSPGVGATLQKTWEDYLTANKINSVGVGFGGINEANKPNIDPIAYNGAEGKENPVVVANTADELNSTLQNLIQLPRQEGSLRGELDSTVEGFGADGGFVNVLNVDGKTYTYLPGQTLQTTGGAVEGVDYTYDAVKHIITVKTAAGGSLTVEFDTAKFIYEGKALSSYWDKFGYTIQDMDGDTASTVKDMKVVYDGVDPGPKPTPFASPMMAMSLDLEHLDALAADADEPAALPALHDVLQPQTAAGEAGGNIAGLGSADAPAAPAAPAAAPQDLALYMPAPLPEEELHQPVHV